MAMTIANNSNALGIQRTLNVSSNSLSGSLQKLSTGYKINSGKDDPSGLIISELLRSQNKGIERAVQNTQEANNVLSIAEGALNEMNNILSKMKQLAIHAANDGVTSAEQIAADQAEIDSSVQTLDRIARTTTYSDENLLNGNKEINFDTNVIVKDSKDMSMVDKGLTDIQQIFKTEDFQLNINFSGKNADGTDNGNSAKKAYFEITTEAVGAEATQVKGVGSGTDSYTLTADQAFTLTGNKGSRTMSFAKGTHLGEMVSSINSVADSTGVKANLIFDKNATALDCSSAATMADQSGTPSAMGSSGTILRSFNSTADGKNSITSGVTLMSISSDGGAALKIGTNLDGDGRMYLRMITDDKYEIYKDEAMTMKVGSGNVTNSSTASTVTAANNSEISGLQLTINTAGGFGAGATSVLQFSAWAQDANATAATAGASDTINFKGLADGLGAAGGTAVNNSAFSGINLGVNTSETGQLFIKAKLNYADTGKETSQILVYKDARMRDEDLVAQSKKFVASTGAQGVNIFAAEIGDTGQNTGLYGVINIGGGSANVELASATVQCENLGLRVSSAEYGSNQFVKINATEGALWSRYDSNNQAVLMNAGLSGTEWTNYGNDAKLALNGQQVTLNGIKGTLTNLDTTANIVFKEGSVGNTTIATVGYDQGKLATKAQELSRNDNGAGAVQALHSTTEIVGNFTGGMQFQLGEGAGDQSRTVYSVKDMTATSLGKTMFHDYFGNSFKTDKYLSVNDLMSGGQASLGNDAVKAMEIISNAISDVSTTRANIGAFQANMLETNANSLNVAMENISKTESYIRDTDVAKESTKYTANQVLVQAGTSMLAQANQLTASALSLIG